MKALLEKLLIQFPNNNQVFATRSISNITFACLLVLVWQLVTSNTSLINPHFLPSPTSFLTSLLHQDYAVFFGHIFSTTLRTTVAFVLAVISSIPPAWLLFNHKVFKGLVSPYLEFLRYLPVPALLPLFIIVFGIGEWAKILVLLAGTWFQLVLQFSKNLSSLPEDYHTLAFTLQFSYRKRLYTFLKAAAPNMYKDAQISLGLCWSYVVIAELLGADSGIGYFIRNAQRFSHIADVYIGIASMGILGLLSDKLFRLARKHLFPYLQA